MNSLIKTEQLINSLKKHLKCCTTEKHALSTTTFSLQFDHVVTAYKKHLKK